MSQRPSLLFVCPRFLFPSDSGGKIRTRDVLRGMKDGAFRITFASPEPEDAARYADEVTGICDRFVGWPDSSGGHPSGVKRIASVFSHYPISVATDRSAEAMRTIAAELHEGYDLIVVDFPHAAVVVPEECALPRLIFTHNVEAEILKRHAALAKFPMNVLWQSQYAKMLRYEREVLGRCDTVVAVSERDGDFFRTEFGHPHVTTIPTGVDLEEFAYNPPPRAGDGTDRKSLVFVGSMNWRANIDAVEFLLDEVWPLVAARRSDLEVLIVGHSPPESLVKKAQDLGIPWTFTGFVDDVRPYIYRSTAFLMPLRIGGGTRIKTYQGMAMGCPVISTTIGVEGLPIDPGRHYLLADTPEAFASAILKLADSAELRQNLSDNAYKFVADNFSSTHVAEIFEQICLETLRRTQRNAA